jgi:uncharacterized protein
VLAWAGTADAELLRARADSFDVLLVGTGASLAALPAGFRAALEATGVGLVVMATPAACRTYNMLLAEGRRIAAALLPMPAEGTAGAPAR